MPAKIDKDFFRVSKTRDCHYVVEAPYLLKDAKVGDEPKDVLFVSRDGVRVQSIETLPTKDFVSSLDICGVIGIVDMISSKYLVVATARTLAATLQAHKIWRITKAKLLPIGACTTVSKRNDPNINLDEELYQSVNEIANSGHLYFSTTYDVTHSVQHNYLNATNKAQQTTIDDRYFFSKHLADPLMHIGAAAEPWVLKAICGFAGTIDLDTTLPENCRGTGDATRTFKFTLISRLNRRRVGMRYVRRGLDFDGNTANNVEMEQIVFHEDFRSNNAISAFVQVRGSVPSIWGQELSLKYRPDLLIADIDKPKVWYSIKKHYDDLKRQYIGEKSVANGADIGKVMCVNLLDVDGFEGRLTKVYEETIKRFADDKVSYEEFPMNKWCKKGNYRNMEILLDRARDRLVNSGWFAANGKVPSFTNAGSLKVDKIQTGLARVSCLDSLDRTNLTCSIFARYMLPYQIQTITPGLPKINPVKGALITDVHDPVATMRQALEPLRQRIVNIWADSGDAVSLMYAGTGALKADVTRTGKKTLAGNLRDGINSLTRYYLNNFVDGRRQDAYDIWTGKAVPEAIDHFQRTEGVKIQRRTQKPLLKSIPGIYYVPFASQVDNIAHSAVEYLNGIVYGPDVQSSRWKSAHIDPNGNPRSVFGLVITAVKAYAPAEVSGAVEFIIAMLVFLYLLVLVRIFHVQGQLVVNRPKLSVEYQNIYELLD
ncbi:SacI homology domain-containing protein [Gaertneriomyces semiglobifer]|nr:SacI homology domain-containing protein [Gaertneriomyces semiglobifer]